MDSQAGLGAGLGYGALFVQSKDILKKRFIMYDFPNKFIDNSDK